MILLVLKNKGSYEMKTKLYVIIVMVLTTLSMTISAILLGIIDLFCGRGLATFESSPPKNEKFLRKKKWLNTLSNTLKGLPERQLNYCLLLWEVLFGLL